MKPTLLLAIIGVALGGPIGYYGVYQPQQRQVQLVRTQITKEQERQQTAVELATLVQQVDERRRRLAPEADPSWLVREVVRLAEKSGVQLTTITPEPPQTVDAFTHLAVNLQFTASYHQLGAFLDNVERAASFIRIEQINVTPTESHEETQASIRVTLSTLSVPPLVAGNANGA